MSEPPPFGVELRRRRVAAGLSLGALARRVHYSKGYLSKVESGLNLASTGLARLCDAALDAHGELVHLLLAVPAGGDPDEQPGDADLGRRETWLIGVGDNGGYFTPVGDGPMANSTAAALGMVFDGPAGVDTNAALALQLAARNAEFAGWMAQEAGDNRMAWWLRPRAGW